EDVINIVVLQADGHEFGLVVDAITDTQEIVVKPLGSRLKETPLFAGATIMGDGLVALILDVLGIAEGARVLAATRDRSSGTAVAEAAAEGQDARTLLLVGLGHDGVADRRAALDLAEVARLEEFPADAVEIAADREVVQY
ncbi:chemotaxis protein CheW, partial [Enterococcus faecalis]|uniref:chemotaxis protein CheW n=1 Tax=Enterococcus faecalis TaxID=1351 RepID=UPI001BAAA076